MPLHVKNYTVFHDYLTDKKTSEPSPSSRKERSATAAMGHVNPGYHYCPKTGIQP
jgi:putative hemolysin